jgi:hypothetical protein
MTFKSRWEEYKEKNGVTILDAFDVNAPEATPEKAKNRYDICKSCEHFIKLTTQCNECKCFMKIKTKLEYAKCPLGKWE